MKYTTVVLIDHVMYLHNDPILYRTNMCREGVWVEVPVKARHKIIVNFGGGYVKSFKNFKAISEFEAKYGLRALDVIELQKGDFDARSE